MNKFKRCLIIISLVCIMMAQSVMAEVNNDEVYGISSNEITDWPQGPTIFSETGVLMEAETGEVLYDKGMNEERYPASITKVMTALLALENTALTDEITFTATALEDMHLGTNIGMQEGEVITMEQALSVMMIKSANEVANQIGEYVGGSQKAFADMMNERAKELGCKNTNFVNASGMPDDNHHTTAYDMALIFREAIKNEEFCKLISLLGYTLEPTNKNSEGRTFSNAHAVFVPNVPQHYKGCIGGKTGVTDAAKSTLVTGATRKGLTYIAVVMRAEDHAQVCADTSALFDYGYGSFKRIDKEESNLVAPKDAGDKLIVKEQPMDESIKKEYYYGEHFLGEVIADYPAETPIETEAMVAEQEESDASEALQTDEPVSESKTLESNSLKMIIIALGGLVAIGLVLVIISSLKKSKKRGRK